MEQEQRAATAMERQAQSTTQRPPSSSQEPANDSQTASEYIDSQLKLEADAREALPYSFDHCTYSLGPLKQNVYSCLTCKPPPSSLSDKYEPAGICYGCSISCHGEHTLVEIFERRDFVCDCGTARFSSKVPCTLRVNSETGLKGPVHSQEPARANDYNKNFRNRFCGCEELYDAETQKGTMFQCIGLATEAQGGCGEDWWHPECLMGLPRDWYLAQGKGQAESNKTLGEVGEEAGEHPVPPGFPDEDEFDVLICYKCVEATPWIKSYANSDGFQALKFSLKDETYEKNTVAQANQSATQLNYHAGGIELSQVPKKRKAEDDTGGESPKKTKVDGGQDIPDDTTNVLHSKLPSAPKGVISILSTDEDFRERFCRCAECYPRLRKLPQLLDEEQVYKPPVSEDGDGQGGSVGTGSLLDRGEAALSNVDRVRAIEGVMVYNHLRDKVKDFLQPFAESGKAVGAEDIKQYFEKLRGDEQGIKAAATVAGNGGGDTDNDNRREQSGY